MSNGDTPTVVPGQTPGTTPPILPSPGGGSSVDEQTKKILETLMRSVTQRRLSATPRPSPVPGMTDPNQARNIGMNTSWPSKWGFERFAAGLQSSIGNAVARHKESQIQKAEATFEYYGNLVNNFLSAQSSGDPKQVEEAQKKLDDFARDKGNMTALHKAAKALNQSWLDPEKTDAYGTAMQRTMEKQKQKDQARTGIQNMFRKVMGMARSPQAQMTPEESVQAGRQIQEKAPTTAGTADPKILQFLETYEGKKEVERMKEEANAKQKELDRLEKEKLQKPVDKVLGEATEAYKKGDLETYKAKLSEAGQMATASKAGGKDSEISLIQKANAGDKDAAAALKVLQDRRLQLAKERGMATQGAKFANFYDPNLKRDVMLPMEEAMSRQSAGEPLVMTSAVPANQIVNIQRAQNSIPKAIAEVQKHIGAWDSAKDRAIFAKIIKDSPMAGEPETWFSNVLSQAAAEDLTPEGQQAVIALRRLGEAMGTVRAASGLPSTAGSMMATWAMLPGAQTPSAQFAKDQLNSIMELMTQETGLTFFGGDENRPDKKSGIIRFTEGKDQYDIPADKVAAFAKAHPNAKRY